MCFEGFPVKVNGIFKKESRGLSKNQGTYETTQILYYRGKNSGRYMYGGPET